MYNEAIKHIGKILLISVPLLLASCGSGETDKAKALLEEAHTAYKAGDYSLSLELTDSLKKTFPREIEVRREAMHLTAVATEGKLLRELETADSISAVLGAMGDSLQQYVKFVNNPIEGYYIAKGADPMSFTGKTGLQARMTPNGDFYLMSSLKGKSVKSTSITVTATGKEATTATVDYDGERNDRSMGAEVITFMGAECDTVGKFVSENVGSPMVLKFNGQSSYSQPLTTAQAEEIAQLYEYATTIRKFKLATLEKERLTKSLDLARSQAARTFVEKDSVK
ncbi:MAG: hypothetical protein NC311_07195 [Muribaculaceae bacterium]|nr:hypothetical protein [Muribaculum sp.]MCM1295312.1 hypothetical protein [Muribaculaceae bacterium]